MNDTYFASLLTDPCNALTETAIDQGRVPIGYSCSLVPAVMLSVPPLFPVRMRAPGVGGTEMADIYQSNLNCSYTRSLLEFALDFRYDFLRGIVHAASCDHLRRLHDNLDYLAPPEFMHILDVPHRDSPEARAWLTDELKALADLLSDRFGANFSDAALTDAINTHNDMLRLLSTIGDLKKTAQPALSGTVFQQLMTAALVSPQDLLYPRLEEFHHALTRREPLPTPRARLMIVGGQLDDPGYIETIESTGALVVADRLCTGSVPGLEPVVVDGSPLQALAAHILKTPSCPRMMEDFDKRLDQIVTTAKAYRVNGIIIEWIKFCDTWGVEVSTLAPALRDHGYRVLCLEREYRRTGEGQLQTRVQAFLESLEGEK